MQRLALSALLLASIAFAPACKKDKKPDDALVEDAGAAATTPPTETPPATADAAPTDAPPGDKPTMANNMANCPSAVVGSKTVVAKEADKVVVTITASDAALETEIRRRAGLLQGFSGTDDTEVKHTGGGTGSGALGKCPVALAGASAKAEDTAGGSKVTLTPKNPAELENLFKLATERAASLPEAPKAPDGAATPPTEPTPSPGGHGSGTGGGGSGGAGGHGEQGTGGAQGGHGSGTGGGNSGGEGGDKGGPNKEKKEKGEKPAKPKKEAAGGGW